MIGIKKLLKSFHFAARGFWYVLQQEQNFRIQFIVAVFVLFAAVFFQITPLEFSMIDVGSLGTPSTIALF